MKFKLIREMDEDGFEVIVSDSVESLDSIIITFKQFLLACGYCHENVELIGFVEEEENED